MKTPFLAAIRTRLAACAAGAVAALAATLLHAAPQAGWWWNPAEPGRGFFLEMQGQSLFFAGYLYAEDGSPVWLASNDPMPQADAYDGRLLSFRDGQSLVGSYRAPSAPAAAGAMSLRFTDDSHATLAWPGGSVPITRYDFHRGPPAAFQPRTGWWWNPDEGGRGFSIELQGDRMFIGAYLYDTAGNPVWYAADATMQSPTRFSAPLLQFANGQTMGGRHRAPTGPASAGTITVDFSSPERATVTLSDDAPKLAKAAKVIEVQPFYRRPAEPSAVQPPGRWTGSFNEVLNAVGDGGTVITWRVEVAAMTWELDEVAPLDGSAYPAFYSVRPGSFLIVDLQLNSPVCEASGVANVDLTSGELKVERDGAYRGKVSMNVSVPTTTTCGDSNGRVTLVQDTPYPLAFAFSGRLEAGAMHGTSRTSLPTSVLNRSWSFDPRP